MADSKPQITFITVPGYFLQDEEGTDPETFNFIDSNFGLIDRAYPSDPASAPASGWTRLVAHLARLNAAPTPANTSRKLLFLGRHGEGYHNAAETRYGTPAWDSYWSLLEGDETSSWADARLNEVGLEQARRAATFWKRILAEEPGVAPERYFVSPLTRCQQTAQTTFGELELPESRPFKPLIKELLRENICPHTCDRRSKKSEIAKNFPGWEFEEGFPEDDPYWSPNYDETWEHRCARSKTALEQVFADARDSTFISITSHSGLIQALLSVLGHRPFPPGTGQAVPVLVEVTYQ